MSNKIAIGYRRVSSRDQIQGTGLDRQTSYIQKFAFENGFELERIFTEKGISGVIGKRPAFSEMIATDYELGLISTTKAPDAGGYQDG